RRRMVDVAAPVVRERRGVAAECAQDLAAGPQDDPADEQGIAHVACDPAMHDGRERPGHDDGRRQVDRRDEPQAIPGARALERRHRRGHSMSQQSAALAAASLCAAVALAAIGCRRAADAPGGAGAPLIHVDKPLGSDLQLAGLSIAMQPDRTSWVVTVHGKVVRARDRRPPLWVHAYPQESQEYFTLNPAGPFAAAAAGQFVADPFVLDRPGAFNLYVGVMGA